VTRQGASGAPIFIIGTERSGSNLVRLILNSHSGIAVPHPPHIVRYFEPLEAGYGDLLRDVPFAALVDDILRLLDLHIYPWGVRIDRQRVLREARPRNAFGVCVALYEQYREHEKKRRWACKSTFMVDHAPAVLRAFPEAKLLFLVRDPRDVAASSRNSVFSTFHPYYTAKLWAAQQGVGLRLLDTLPKKNIELFKYEDLLADPKPVVERMCAFLEEPFEEGMLRYFETEEAKKSSRLSESWKNTGQPILRDNTKKYLRHLSTDDVRNIEVVAREPMIRLGYELTHEAGDLAHVHFSDAERRRFWLEERRLKLRTELRSLKSDRNVGRRWARATMMAYLGVRRGRRGAFEEKLADAE
jgi:hypothetical protein